MHSFKECETFNLNRRHRYSLLLMLICNTYQFKRKTSLLDCSSLKDLYIVGSAEISSSHLQLVPESKFKMKYGSFCQRIPLENFRAADSDLQFGLNDSLILQLVVSGEICLDSI